MQLRWVPLVASLVLVAGLLSGQAWGAPEAEMDRLFAELPPQHWSYGAVRSLSTAGLVSEPPAAFGAGLTVTRLEMALEVGEAMDRLRAAAPPEESATLTVLIARYNRRAPTPLGLEQMHLLEELAREFSAELNVLGYTVVPSPQSFRLEQPAASVPVPELDAVWLGVGEGRTLAWSPAAGGLAGLLAPEEGSPPHEEEGLPADESQSLSLGARIRLLPTVELEGEVEPWGERAGYRIGAGVDLGDLYISGGYDVPTAGITSSREEEAAGAEPGRTRWGVRWTTGDTELTASAEYVGLDQLQVVGGAELPSRVELGLGVAVQGGGIRIGWSREAQAVELPAVANQSGSPDDSETPTDGDPAETEAASPAPPRQVNTTLKLTYDLSSVASLTVGYQLIDFTGVDGDALRDAATTEATAEFTLRF